MAGDFLNDPVGPPGARLPHARRRRWAVPLVVVALAAVGVGTLVARQVPRSDPAAAVATIETAPVPPPMLSAPTGAELASAPAVAKTKLSGTEIDQQSGVTIVRPPGTVAPSAQIITVPQDMTVTLQPAPDPRLVEPSRYGPLPRRGADGTKARDAYARPLVVDASLRSDAPKIALLVGGMGLNGATTASASTSLPPAVTFGFAPYGDDLERQVRDARNAGHEVILQVPMEGFGDPSAAAMPRMLTSGIGGKDLIDRLHWLMARFVGYVGIANFLGGKFTADPESLTPVIRDVAGRGLLFMDDGTAPRSLAGPIAAENGVPFVRADVVLDSVLDPAAIDGALKKLEARARDRGTAVGFASALPVSVGRVAAFANGLAARGIALVPVSALASVTSPDKQAVARP